MTTDSPPKWHAARSLETDRATCWEAGTLRAWALRTQHEWRIATSRQEEKTAIHTSADEPLPESPAWKRWAFSEEADKIGAEPAMPDKPLVVRPDSPLRIPPGNEVVFFVSVPVWLRFFAGSGRNRTFLTEEPSVVLSKTWFGEPTMGELCYALKTSASRSLEGIKTGDHRCVCPLLLRNDSEAELPFQKLCIRTLFVNIYQGASRLWSEEIRISFRGKDQGSEVSFGSAAPKFEETGERIGDAREIAPKSFIRRSFDTLLML